MKRASAKAALRKTMALRRDELSEEERAKRSKQACAFAAEVMDRLHLQSMMIYVPFRSELDSRPLIEWAWKQGIQVIVPRSLTQDRSMELYKLQAWDELVSGAYGISEPDPLRSQNGIIRDRISSGSPGLRLTEWAEGLDTEAVITTGCRTGLTREHKPTLVGSRSPCGWGSVTRFRSWNKFLWKNMIGYWTVWLRNRGIT